jgi:molecular chaperone DnaK (HSP70)
MPAGLARIEVTFLIDADGILQVAAKDLKTGNEQSIEVRPTFGLTEAEISGMVQSSEVHLAEDESYRKLVEARNDADPVLRGCEKNLGAAFRLLPVEEARNVEARVESLRVAMNGSDPESIRQAAFQLDQASRRLADMIVAEALSSQKH